MAVHYRGASQYRDARELNSFVSNSNPIGITSSRTPNWKSDRLFGQKSDRSLWTESDRVSEAERSSALLQSSSHSAKSNRQPSENS
jgi:hypothetical protein